MIKFVCDGCKQERPAVYSIARGEMGPSNWFNVYHPVGVFAEINGVAKPITVMVRFDVCSVECGMVVESQYQLRKEGLES